MKRFITYLYEYEQGQKTKNTGFVRVDERNGKVIFQISVRNYIGIQGNGEIYAYVWKNGLLGIELGKLSLLNSQTDMQLEFEANNIRNSGFILEEVVGVGLIFSNNNYMASCWDDAYAEVIGSKKFRMWEEQGSLSEMSVSMQVEEQEAEDVKEDLQIENDLCKDDNLQETVESSESVTYELVAYQKMELNAIKNLPSPNWYLCNNRFLVHGFFNYGYLVLKKTTEADGEKTYLGVPGIYEKPEMVMATLFGFPEFQTLPEEVSEAKMEEIISVPAPRQMELKQGTFGCWFIPIQME
ncbi:MAG: hypothetical protein E7283_05650 [Lachnospiraceae bacterium]|nr:hypothetical protein [Lachnospiraceae bacterium]